MSDPATDRAGAKDDMRLLSHRVLLKLNLLFAKKDKRRSQHPEM